jgi:hypothetical protein
MMDTIVSAVLERDAVEPDKQLIVEAQQENTLGWNPEVPLDRVLLQPYSRRKTPEHLEYHFFRPAFTAPDSSTTAQTDGATRPSNKSEPLPSLLLSHFLRSKQLLGATFAR